MALRRRARPAAIPTDRRGALAVLAAAVVALTLAACTAGAAPDDRTTAPTPGTPTDGPTPTSEVTTRETASEGFPGVYAVPDGLSADDPRPAVLAFGGSEGGSETGRMVAEAVAGLGYPALGIGYFKGVDQPSSLEEVPTETFLDALTWLREQPGVDDDAVLAFGVSRGGEMALWLAANRPELVHGAIAPVGADAVMCGYPDFSRSAWTLGDEPLPCSSDVHAQTAASPEARIPVEQIDGPVVLACGTEDELWDSCAFLRRAEGSLADRGAGTTVAIHGDGASHFVATPPWLDQPWGDPDTETEDLGVRRQLWTAVDEALASLDS
ncbi:prolyl oligopeptidase family serine peptidase [Cellulosimicrobium cellulans]|uniref:acyl-CoA thioester hydrolase/BAAT C-terminal domain-containing protein n=1 Tax=Cellulosimicrobium cellulans TaxID=1710 RepID=UPI001EDC17CB|nr:acyl-CoA thioester hydrolase/BAAT C-terminal domain-containing protein [Cellulosimicrobium cellulans]UKJ62680.1 prolyl oligopeptidase family serine peptidase [Cellulosimicrobium cellulans]